MPRYGYFVIGETKPLATWVGETMILHEGKNLQIYDNGEMSTVVNIAPGCAVQQLSGEDEHAPTGHKFEDRLPELVDET
jgi:hypothetical protein